VKASACTVKASACMKTAAEARLPAHRVASGYATVIEATKRARMRAWLAMPGESTLRCRATAESITVNIAAVKCASTMKSAAVLEVVVRATGVVVAIYKCSAVRDVHVAVVNDCVVMPVRSPVMPSPAETAKETDRIADAKQDSRCGNEQARIPIPPRPSHQRPPIDDPRIVFGNVNNFRVAWRDHNCLSFLSDVFRAVLFKFPAFFACLRNDWTALITSCC